MTAISDDGFTDWHDIPLYHDDGQPNLKNVASYAAVNKQLINIEDAYCSGEFDFSGTKIFDQAYQFRSKSFLTVPLLNHENDVIGVLQLINAQDPMTKQIIPFVKQMEAIISALASYVSIALNNHMLIQDHKALMDAFAKCIGTCTK